MSDPFDFSRYSPSVATSTVLNGAESSTGETALRVGRAPWPLLVLTTAIAAVAIASTVLIRDDGPATLVSWFVAGPVAMAALTAYTLRDTRARAEPVYVSSDRDRVLYVLAVAAISAAVILAAFRVAGWVGHL